MHEGLLTKITFVTLKGFCLFKHNPPKPPNMSFLHYISSFAGTSYKNLEVYTATRTFTCCCCFMLSFTSADIIIHKFLELHSTLYLKKDFCRKFFFFLMDSLKPRTPLV